MMHIAKKQYNSNLRRGLITDEMVRDAAFTFAAEGALLGVREMDAMFHRGQNPDTFRRRRIALWQKKARLISSWTNPTCIHVRYKKDIDVIFEGEPGYDENHPRLVGDGIRPILIDGHATILHYIEVQRLTFDCFYGYEVAGRLFHVPISMEEATSYTGLKISPLPERPAKWWFKETLPMKFCNRLLREVENTNTF